MWCPDVNISTATMKTTTTTTTTTSLPKPDGRCCWGGKTCATVERCPFHPIDPYCSQTVSHCTGKCGGIWCPFPSPVPSPTPPNPVPSPSSGRCCWGGVSCATAQCCPRNPKNPCCNSSASCCTRNCGGIWCPDVKVV